MIKPNQITKWNYGRYSSDNYGAHSLAVKVPNNTYYFSYDTLIAFYHEGELIMRENIWGSTTGKHMNWLSRNKDNRVNSEIFTQKLNESLGETNE